MDDSFLYDKYYFLERHYSRDEQRKKMYAQERARLIARTKPGRILDIGCGLGDFLAGLDDRWEKFGYDPSQYAREFSAQRGIHMIDDLPLYVDGLMDVVVMRGVLQHMAFPMESLAHARRILRPGGLLAILATPDADGLVYQIWGQLAPLDPERNWIVFGHRCLANILKRMNFEAEFIYPYLGTPYARPIRDLWKFCLSLVAGWRPFAFWGNMFECYAVRK